MDMQYPQDDSPEEMLRAYRERQKQREVKDKSGFVYLLRANGNPYWKIGMTKNVERRVKSYSTSLLSFEMDCIIKTDDRFKLEKELHKRYSSKRIQGEWFDLSWEDVDDLRILSEEQFV